MRHFRHFLLILLILIIVSPLVLVFLALERTPAVRETKLINTERTVRARALTKRVLITLLNQSDTTPVFISASEKDLNSLMAFMVRGINRLEGRINVTPLGLDAAMTFRVPHNPVGDYINLHFCIDPSESGLHLSKVSIGRIEISDIAALFIPRFILDLVLRDENGTILINSVKSVIFDQNSVTFNFHHIPDIRERKDKIKERLKFFRDDLNLLSDPATVRIYYSKLMELGNRIQAGKSVSLSYFVGPLFQLAQQRSYNSDPAEENQAALLALAMYVGDWRFERLIGSVRTEKMRLHKQRYLNVLLDGRKDLRLHFVISAGLKIVADSGITYSIGEFKELLDTRQGGSGFSFADLAADRAGIRFAKAATDRLDSARRIQSVLASEASETMFFPMVNDLPEELSQSEFERLYGNVENAKYLSLMNVIDERISRLPAYSAMGFEDKQLRR